MLMIAIIITIIVIINEARPPGASRDLPKPYVLRGPYVNQY